MKNLRNLLLLAVIGLGSFSLATAQEKKENLQTREMTRAQKNPVMVKEGIVVLERTDENGKKTTEKVDLKGKNLREAMQALGETRASFYKDDADYQLQKQERARKGLENKGRQGVEKRNADMDKKRQDWLEKREGERKDFQNKKRERRHRE